jgi:hypothetical protein
MTGGAELICPGRGEGLPGWCDRYLDPPGSGDFFAGRLWYETVIAHALPAGTVPVLARCEEVLLPLLRIAGGRLASLTTVYSLEWRPLAAPGIPDAALREAGRRLGRRLRPHTPVRLDTFDPAAPGLGPLVDGLRSAGLVRLRFDHFGNWHEVLSGDAGWEAYLANRPPALRTTIRRKVARCEREMRFDLVAAPGPALEAGIAAYEQVRARSWKPDEPSPDFDGALMRAAAAAGQLRLGVLRTRADHAPVAAQYWVLDRGGVRALLLKLAHAEESRAASPGTALTAMLIRHLLETDRVRELDFGVGDDAYKRLWVAHRRQRMGVVLADPRGANGLLTIGRHFAGGAMRRLRALSTRGEAR